MTALDVELPPAPPAVPAAPPPPPPPAATRRRPNGGRGAPSIRAVAEWSVVPTRVLLIVAFLAGWLVLYVQVLSGVEQRHAQHALYDEFRQELSNGTAPLGGNIHAGKPVALLSIPAAGISREVVVQGTAAGVLRDGPGHLRDTALPGQGGVSVLYGRATMFGAPFADIDQLQAGDQITAVTGQGTFHYSVVDVREDGDPLPVAPTAGSGRLVLVTANGSGWRTGWAPNRAIYVDADLVSKAVPSPAGQPTAIAPAEQQLRSDNSEHVYIQIVLWLQAALLIAAGVAWAWRAWNRWQVWLAGVPVVLAVLWELSSASVQLLPNLL